MTKTLSFYFMFVASAAHAFPTTQEIINCAKGGISSELIATEVRVINQTLDLISNPNCPPESLKCFVVKFQAENRGQQFDGSIRLKLGTEIQTGNSFCEWRLKGYFGAMEDFKMKPIN